MPMPSAGSIATAALGLGVTLASTFASSLGLSVHQQRIGFAVGIVLIAIGAAFYLRRPGDRAQAEPDHSISSVAGRDSFATGRDLSVAREDPISDQSSVPGLCPGDLARRAVAAPTSKSDPPLHRALADGISELQTIRRQLARAAETRKLQRKTPSRMRRPLGDHLTDQGWHESRATLDEAYGACEDFYARLHVPARRFEGPMAEMTSPTIEDTDDLPGVLGKVDRALEELQARQGSGRSRPARSALRFERVEVGKPRPIHEANVFHENWSGVPVVFSVVNPQGGARALAVRPTVIVEDAEGNVLQGPTNARWANPVPPNVEEVERDIPANGATVAIDTVIQGVNGAGFWLVTDEGLKRGLKANTDRIEVEDIRVTVSLQGENVATVSKTVRVRRGFPKPALGDGTPTDTMIPPAPPKEPPEPDPNPLPEKPASDEDHHSAAQRSRHPVGLSEELAAERDEGTNC